MAKEEIIEYDWERAKECHSPERIELLRQYHNKPISEEEWVAFIGALPKKKLHNSQTRQPHAAKHDYRRLKSKFGFFVAP